MDRFDVDHRMAQRPAQRMFRAHPALGLVEADGRMRLPLHLHELGVRWLALDPDEQRHRETDFLRALLQRAASDPGAAFEAVSVDDALVALAERTGARMTGDETVAGALTPTAISTLAGDLPETLAVDGGPELMLLTTDGWMDLRVLIDRWKAPALEREVTEAWWQAADRRGAADERMPEVRRRHAAERELRAHVLVIWKRSSRLAITALVALSAAVSWPPLGDSLGDWVLRCVGAVAILWPLDTLMERWSRGWSGPS